MERERESYKNTFICKNVESYKVSQRDNKQNYEINKT